MKRYYPAEFIAAVLSNGKGFYRPLVYILECHRLGIPLLAPWVNDPGPGFAVRDGIIRVPAVRVKGLTERTQERLLQAHQRDHFGSLEDFCERVGASGEELELLMRAGGAQKLPNDRRGLHALSRRLPQAADAEVAD